MACRPVARASARDPRYAKMLVSPCSPVFRTESPWPAIWSSALRMTAPRVLLSPFPRIRRARCAPATRSPASHTISRPRRPGSRPARRAPRFLRPPTIAQICGASPERANATSWDHKVQYRPAVRLAKICIKASSLRGARGSNRSLCPQQRCPRRGCHRDRRWQWLKPSA